MTLLVDFRPERRGFYLATPGTCFTSPLTRCNGRTSRWGTPHSFNGPALVTWRPSMEIPGGVTGRPTYGKSMVTTASRFIRPYGRKKEAMSASDLGVLCQWLSYGRCTAMLPVKSAAYRAAQRSGCSYRNCDPITDVVRRKSRNTTLESRMWRKSQVCVPLRDAAPART